MKTPNMIACHGEAHANAHIDNCGICLNHGWGKLLTCSVCGSVLKMSQTGKTGKCVNGHGMFRKLSIAELLK